jgi:hypothetical protein
MSGEDPERLKRGCGLSSAEGDLQASRAPQATTVAMHDGLVQGTISGRGARAKAQHSFFVAFVARLKSCPCCKSMPPGRPSLKMTARNN